MSNHDATSKAAGELAHREMEVAIFFNKVQSQVYNSIGGLSTTGPDCRSCLNKAQQGKRSLL